MTYYLVAYIVFWAGLFGYLLGMSSRQEKLNLKAVRLTERLLSRRPTGSEAAPEGDAP